MPMNDPLNKSKRADEHLQISGEMFIKSFHHLLNVPRIHQAENRLAIKATKAFISAGLEIFATSEAIVLEARHGRFFLSGHKLLMRRQAAVYMFGLLSVFENLALSGLRFNYRFKSISPAQAHKFATLIIKSRQKANPLNWLSGSLASPEFKFVDILTEPEENPHVHHAGKTVQAHRIYSFAYNSIREISRDILEKRRAGIRKPLRIVQEIVDFAIQDKSVLFGLSTIKDYDDYTYTHSVNVAILSVCLGHQIGLSENSLLFLGVCGLFHDLGKIDIPIEIITKPGPLTEDEFKVVQQHSLNSVRQILKLQAHSDLIARIVLGPFEHHLKYDLTGYPKVNWKRPISLFGRIIEICDVYDALTSPRIYRPDPFSQDRALEIIAARSGTDFDPILVKWFINMAGIYPVGTVLIFDTGEMGVVCEGGSFEDNQQPRVLMLKKGEAGQFLPATIVDLHQADPETGKCARTIKSTHHASEFGIQPMTYLMEVQQI
jgi:HD-GYP domain-containing protein (c-di-GMP phosphodiesterase class II)